MFQRPKNGPKAAGLIGDAWRRTTAPAGICGPIGSTEQPPLVAWLVNELGISLKHGHFWGMDAWVVGGKAVAIDFPMSFARADMAICFDRIRLEQVQPRENLHFLATDPIN